MNLKRPILISLSPNTSKEDVLLATKLILRPESYLAGPAIAELEAAFKKYFKTAYAVSFNSGRSALFAILECLGVGKEDEVLLQAYTCVAVPNAVLWCGAKPVYVDIKEATFNMEPADFAKKITKKSRGLIVQHTFGQPAEMGEILKIAKEHNLWVVEDCAHALGAKYKDRKVGTLGAAAFFSFGRDKVISSVFGGLAITQNRELGEKLQACQQGLKFPPRFFVFRQLLHPIAFSVILPLYNVFNLGKVILVCLQKLRLLSLPVLEEEKRGGRPRIFPSRLPSALAQLALSQFGRVGKFLSNEKSIEEFYRQNLDSENLKLPSIDEGQEGVVLRYTVKTREAKGIREFAKKRGILLGDWYEVISPRGVDLKKLGYKRGSCPVAEKTAELSLNLPTHPRMSLADARRVARLLNNYFDFKNMEIREIENKDIWERFASSYTPNTFLQSWGWGEYQRLSGNRIFRLGAFENQTLVGVCLATFIRAKKGPFLYCQHGPLIDWRRKDHFEALLSRLEKIARQEGAWFLRLTPLLAETSENRDFIQSLALNPSPVHNIDAQVTLILDLRLAEGELLKNMRKSTRCEIKRAGKVGVRVYREAGEAALKRFYNLYRLMQKRQKFVPYPYERFANEYKAFAPLNQQEIFFAEYKGDLSSAAIINYYGETAFYNHGASVLSQRGVSTSHLLQWEIVKFVKSKGFRFYNFWGGIAAGMSKKHPWWGITVFKRGFGGEQVNYLHAQDLPLSPRYHLTSLIEKFNRRWRGF